MHEGNGPGLTPRRLGQRDGAESVTLTESQMPEHSHTATVKASSGGRGGVQTTPINNYLNEGGSYRSSADGLMAGGSVKVNNTGGNQSVNNIQPWLAINFIIALQGIFPSRS
jgi:microcystin-dependent protein